MPVKARYSPQREAIQSIVCGQKGHLSVEAVYRKALRVHPKISRGTVYRNLQQLEAQRLISAVQGPDQLSYYEAFAEPHHHFVCTGCKDIRNLDTPNVNICTACITSKTPLKIEHIVTTLIGKCERCLTNIRKVVQ